MKVKNVRIRIRSEAEFRDEITADMKKIWKGEKVEPKEAISFTSVEAMDKFLTKERLRILKVIRKEHPASIYELAKILKRDLKNVSDDVHFLANLGLIELKKSKTGRKQVTPSVAYDQIVMEIPV